MSKVQIGQHELQLSSLMAQIQHELKDLHIENIELTEQLTSFYQNLCQLRQSFSITTQTIDFQSNSNLLTVTTDVDNLLLKPYLAKPRSDSEPNIFVNRQKIITVVEDFQ